jgi:Glycosyl transferase family 2
LCIFASEAAPRERIALTALPRVDILINSYNYAGYVGAAIDSALAQTYATTRVIVVDDGSTDGSGEVIRSYAGRVEPVFKANGGQASAMNAGMDLVRGEVVMFLDADDVLEPFAAERVAREFAARPGLARVHYRLRVVDHLGSETGEIKPPMRLGLSRGNLVRATLRTPFDAAWLPTSGNAFSAAALRRMLPVPEEEYRLCADWYLVHVSSLMGPIGAIDEPLARYRVHAANGFTRSGPHLDIENLGDTVGYAETTRRHLFRIARLAGIDHDDRQTASMCDVANRAVLLRIAPGRARHADSRLGLARLGGRAAAGRRDVGLAMKAVFLIWLAAVLAAPHAIARRLGELFLLPERRSALNRLLGSLHRS